MSNILLDMLNEVLDKPLTNEQVESALPDLDEFDCDFAQDQEVFKPNPGNGIVESFLADLSRIEFPNDWTRGDINRLHNELSVMLMYFKEKK